MPSLTLSMGHRDNEDKPEQRAALTFGYGQCACSSPDRVKARWGLFGSSIEASDLVDVEIVRVERAFGREPETER